MTSYCGIMEDALNDQYDKVKEVPVGNILPLSMNMKPQETCLVEAAPEASLGILPKISMTALRMREERTDITLNF